MANSTIDIPEGFVSIDEDTDIPEGFVSITQEEPPPPSPTPIGEKIPIKREKRPGVWGINQELDGLFSGEDDMTDLLPADVSYDFGKIIGMTLKPDETKDKMANSLYYSVELDLPLDIAFSNESTINSVLFGPGTTPATARQRIVNRYKAGKSEVQSMDLGYEVLKETWRDWDKFDEQLKNFEKLQGQVPEDVRKEFRGFWEKTFGATAEQIPILWETIKAGGPAAIGGGFIGGTVAGIASIALPTIGEEPVAIGAGLKLGAKIGAALYGAERIYELEAGGMFVSLATMKDDYGNRIDPRYAVVASHAVGAINGGIEIGKWTVLLSTFGIGPELFKKSVGRVTKKLAGDKVLNSIVARSVAKYGIALGAETLQEVEQETTNIVFEELAKELNNARKGTDFKPITHEDLKARYGEVTAESLRAFGVILAPGVGISGAIEAVKAKSDLKVDQIKVNREKDKVILEVKAPEVEELFDEEISPGVVLRKVPVSKKLEEAKKRAAAKLRRKVTKVAVGAEEGPLIGRLRTRMEDLIEQHEAEPDADKRKALIDEMEKLDVSIEQLSDLQGKNITKLKKIAKHFKVDVPKGATKQDVLDLLVGTADLSRIKKTETGFQVKIPIADTKAGRGWEVYEFDTYAEAVDLVEERMGEVPMPEVEAIKEEQLTEADEKAAQEARHLASIAQEGLKEPAAPISPKEPAIVAPTEAKQIKPQKPVKTAKYDKADIQSATEAVKRTNPNEDRFIYATAEGYIIDKEPPIDKNQSYRVVHPDYSYEDVHPFAEGEEARVEGRRKVLKERVRRGEPTPEPLLREFKSEKWAQEALKKAPAAPKRVKIEDIPAQTREMAIDMAAKTGKNYYIRKDRAWHSKTVPPKTGPYFTVTPEGKITFTEKPAEGVKRVISKEAYEKAKKRLTDRDIMRAGLDPQGFADMAVIGAYHIESGLRTFGAWSKKMIEEFGEKIKPNLKRIWKEAKNRFKYGDYDIRKGLIRQAHALKAVKGISEKEFKELKKKSTVSGLARAYKYMTVDELETLISKLKATRPRTVYGKRVITQKTEKAIQSLKSSLKKKLAMTEAAFAEILRLEVPAETDIVPRKFGEEKVPQKRVLYGYKEPKYIDAKNFITQTEGMAIIKRMHDTGEVLRVTQKRTEAVAKDKEITGQVVKLEEQIKKKPKRDPYRVESMRYYAQQAERVTGEPVYAMYKDIIDTKDKIEKTKFTRMAKLEAEVPGFKDIAGDEKALQRVADYIASQSDLEGAPERPKDITKAEIKMAEGIQKIFREYELTARVAKFFNWYYYEEGIAEYEQNKREIHKAEDIYDSQGKEALIEYLRTQTWGIVKSGYEPLETVVIKIRPYNTGPKAVGKGHIKVRTDIVYKQQERNILQRLNSYMRQMDLLYNMSPKINAFIRLFDDNITKFKEPKKVTQSVESFIKNIKRYNIGSGLWGDIMARTYAQVSQVIIMSQPVLAFRNLFQNLAFGFDKSTLFNPLNNPLTAEDAEYLETHVQQLRGMMEEYFMTNERALPGLKTLTDWLRHIKIYGWSDVTNRHWGFWAKINQVRRAWEADNLEERMVQAKFEDMTEEEQIMALNILADEGVDAMARYVSNVHIDNIHFLYERAQRSPSEMDELGRVMGNLLLFPRAYMELMAKSGNVLKDKKSTEKQKLRAGKRIVSVMAGGYLTGMIYMTITGRKRNPYDPFGIVQITPGGLLLGATIDVFEVGSLTIRALAGNKEAMYALTSKLPNMADDFIPFYDWTFRGIEAVTDTKNIDMAVLREIYGLIDEEYKRRKGSHKMKRSFIKKLQYVFAGPSVDIKDEKKKKGKKITRKD